MVGYVYGLILLDEYEQEQRFIKVTLETYSDKWTKFVDRANALLKSSLVSHTELIYAVLVLKTAPSVLPEHQKYRDRVNAFLGENFDIKNLGTWREYKSAFDFNDKMGECDGCYCFTYSIDLERYNPDQ
jgi:hypothetical protein